MEIVCDWSSDLSYHPRWSLLAKGLQRLPLISGGVPKMPGRLRQGLDSSGQRFAIN
jgi:hypothetical protein